MKQKNRLFPPNFDDLPDNLKKSIEEKVYHIQLRTSHACLVGDPRLTSSNKIEMED